MSESLEALRTKLKIGYYIRCINCRKIAVADPNFNSGRAAVQLAEEGWTEWDGRVYCLQCAPIRYIAVMKVNTDSFVPQMKAFSSGRDCEVWIVQQVEKHYGAEIPGETIEEQWEYLERSETMDVGYGILAIGSDGELHLIGERS